MSTDTGSHALHQQPRSEHGADHRAGAGPGPVAARTLAPHDEPDPAPARRRTPARSPALDRLRGAALVAMLVHHLTQWLTGDARDVLPGWRSFALTDVAAVAFFCTAGASVALLSAGRRRRGASGPAVAAEIARRYGLLVPVGVALHWWLWRDAFRFGVLEALGVTVVLAAAVAAVVPAKLLPAVAAATLAAGVVVDRMVDGRGGWVAEVLGGAFPLLTYLGFVLVGVAAVRSKRYDDHRWVTGAALVTAGAALIMTVTGTVPARYPGDASFVVPGLAGTAVLYALGHLPWPRALAAVDGVLRAASTRALGIFVAHYLLFGALRHLGVTEGVEAAVAVPVAVAVTIALCVVAPRVPQLPWSPRTGARPAATRC